MVADYSYARARTAKAIAATGPGFTDDDAASSQSVTTGTPYPAPVSAAMRQDVPVHQRIVDASSSCEAWISPRLAMTFRPTQVPIAEPVAKLGGQPAWVDVAQWPLSRADGDQMMFVGQVPVPGFPGHVAYLFMTDDDSGAYATWGAEDGENALIVQPGGRVPAFLNTVETATGPPLWRPGSRSWDKVPVELSVDLTPLLPEHDGHLDARAAAGASERQGAYLDRPESDLLPPQSYVGGAPVFWQQHLPPVSDQWRFFFQIDGCEGTDGEPYVLRLGGGTGYAFLSPDGMEGRFAWDCV